MNLFFLFQNDVALYFEPYWKKENEADINIFGASLS